jgi:hypothetical protein
VPFWLSCRPASSRPLIIFTIIHLLSRGFSHPYFYSPFFFLSQDHLLAAIKGFCIEIFILLHFFQFSFDSFWRFFHAGLPCNGAGCMQTLTQCFWFTLAVRVNLETARAFLAKCKNHVILLHGRRFCFTRWRGDKFSPCLPCGWHSHPCFFEKLTKLL